MSDATSPQESGIVQPTPLKELILEAAKNDKLAPELYPTKIDLGEFGKEAERLVSLSQNDPEHPEYASLACKDRYGRILLLNNPIRGDVSSVGTPDYEGKLPILLIHTHGDIDIPFSTEDFLPLVIVPGKKLDAVPAIILATPSMKMLFMRSRETPFMSNLKAFDLTAMMELHPIMEDEKQIYEFSEKEENEGFPVATKQYKRNMESVSNKRMFMLTRFAQEHSIKMYSTPLKNNVVSISS